MSKIRPGLGRGLDALLNPNASKNENKPMSVSSDNIGSDDGASFNILAKLPITKIVPNPFQPRTEFKKEALEELTRSILENGLIQPITVRRKLDGNYELISGERRLRACTEIGYKEIPGYIIRVESNEAMLALSLIENIQREDLNPIEIAIAYKRLMEECQLSQEEIADKVGKNRTTITNSIRLLKLPIQIQDSLVKNEISAGHARALINISNEAVQLDILKKIVKENLSVRKVEALVQSYSDAKRKKKENKDKDKEKEKGLRILSQIDIENKLRETFGTKVICKQKKDGSGEITIEYYSNEELERLLDLLNSVSGSSY